MTGQAWVVYAARTSYCGEILEILNRRGDTCAALVDNLDDGPAEGLDGPTIAPTELDAVQRALPGVVPLTTPGFRALAVRDARKHGLTQFPALVDPTAVIAATATIAEGVTVNAGTVIGARTALAEFAAVNRSASIGHDCVVERYATIGPGAVLGGSVTVGPGVFVGVGATVLPGVRLGANAVIGGGAVVTKDVAPFATVVGNPATVLRIGETGYQGATVTDA